VALRDAVSDTAQHPRDGAPAWPDGAPVHTLTVPGGVGAPAAARSAARGLLRFHLPPRAQADATLLISELVANAVMHGGARENEDRICIHLAFRAPRAVVEICDSGPGFKAPSAPEARPEGGGMGLMLLHTLSSAWGVNFRDGARVWFEMAH
jgi:anti-sigma regulatory factor (Ser/Thr protein kinase)